MLVGQKHFILLKSVSVLLMIYVYHSQFEQFKNAFLYVCVLKIRQLNSITYVLHNLTNQSHASFKFQIVFTLIT